MAQESGLNVHPRGQTAGGIPATSIPRGCLSVIDRSDIVCVTTLQNGRQRDVAGDREMVITVTRRSSPDRTIGLNAAIFRSDEKLHL